MLYACEPYRGPLTPPEPAKPPQPIFAGAVELADPPPPITGGTLRVLASARVAVAADPDRDRIYVADLVAREVVADIPLETHDEPGRLVEDAAGRVHVVLRNGGAVFSLWGASWEQSTRRPVCTAPRGIAYEAATDALHVACAGGELVTLPAAGGEATRIVQLDHDLRDVVVTKTGLAVSRLRTAEVLMLDADGHPINRKRPADFNDFGPAFVPNGGLRLVTADDGGVFLLHQRALADGVFISTEGGYGGASPCSDPIVHTAVTDLDRTSPSAAAVLAGVSVATDLALSPARGEDAEYAIVAPGNAFIPNSPTVFIANRDAASLGGQPCTFGQEVQVPAQPIAASYDKDGKLFVQTRDPAMLVQVEDAKPTAVFGLNFSPRHDSGHAIFHSNAGGGVACASCHLEGGDDAHVWDFVELGPRRTQTLRGGIAGTAPFHWDGDQADFEKLTTEVFQRRMGGPKVKPDQVRALQRWIDRLPALAPPPAHDPDAVSRGRALFEGEAACGACHSGPMLTNNDSFDVGTGGNFQVPSLVGLVWRAPYLHDGRAATLKDRFRADGGLEHGRTTHLSADQIDDLVAYLETL